MWDVLTWHDGTLAIAWWAVIVLVVALLSIGGTQLRDVNNHACGMRDACADRSAAVGEMDVLADVTLSRQKRLAGVQPHPDPDQAGLERHFPRSPSSDCRPRIGEHIEERIALSVHLDTALGREDFRSTRRCSASASAYASAPSSCSSRVDPSTSVKGK